MPEPNRTPAISRSRTDVQQAPGGAFEATVAALGAEGDGVLHADGASLFVPFVLPGERVRVHRDGRQTVLEAVLQASADRIEPPCTLFGRCGGCMIQHMNLSAMARFKQGLVCDALTQAGFALPAAIAYSETPPNARRRMDLALRRTPTGMLVGLHRRAGDVVDLSECHVLDPSLFALVGAMRPMLLRLTCLRAAGSVIVNLLDSGPDLLLSTDVPPDTGDRARLAAFARAHDIPRIAWRPQKGPANDGDPQTETVCLLGPVHHVLSGVRISPPPGAFLQASLDSERAITTAVMAGVPAALKGRARIIELYAGCGTLSFALAKRGKVSAYEGQQDAAACLRQGAGGIRIAVEQRDLVRQPLLAKALREAAVIVLDPPFAGAGPQMAEIARAGAARVIIVSCNPRALTRDAALLHQAGYGLEQLSVIDQFLWSSGIESVSVFTRA